jgi:tripartite-type tricarboxylate transporter receptor subunit TctC
MRTALAFITLLAVLGSAYAQGYPEKTVTVVVPFPAGGATDPVARALTQRMSELWKQPVVVLNRAGAGGNIGSESVAKAAPDGYTLLFGTTSLSIGPSLYAKLGFDVLKDFAAISQASIAPNVLVVHPSVPARSVKELLALARARPKQLISASAGVGTSNHLCYLQFVGLAKVDILHVPYKGAAPAVADTVGGHAHMTFAPAPATLALVQAGRLRALAVTSRNRTELVPGVPGMAEAGLPDYEISFWYGFFVPAGTPAEVTRRLYAATSEALRAPIVAQALARDGTEVSGSSSPADFAAFLAQEAPLWTRLVKESGAKAD